MPKRPRPPEPPGRWAKSGEIVLDDEFRNLLPESGAEDRDAMLRTLHNEGCPEPLYAWNWNEQLILLLGYRFFPTLRAYPIRFRVIEKTFTHRDQARQFIFEHVLSRGLMTRLALSYFRGKRFQGARPKRGGDHKSEKFQQTGDRLKAGALAKLYFVDRATIFRDAELAEAVDILVTHGGEEVRPILFAHDAPLTRRRILDLAGLDPEVQRRQLDMLRITRTLPPQERAEAPAASITLPNDPLALVQTLVRRRGPAFVAQVLEELLRTRAGAETVACPGTPGETPKIVCAWCVPPQTPVDLSATFVGWNAPPEGMGVASSSANEA